MLSTRSFVPFAFDNLFSDFFISLSISIVSFKIIHYIVGYGDILSYLKSTIFCDLLESLFYFLFYHHLISD